MVETSSRVIIIREDTNQALMSRSASGSIKFTGGRIEGGKLH